MEELFMTWIVKHIPNAQYINTSSTVQMQHILFGQWDNKKFVSKTRVFDVCTIDFCVK